MHQRRPQRACFVGDTTQKTDPVLYLNSVVHLVTWYRERGLGALRAARDGRGATEAAAGAAAQNMAPLVINTPGWVKGLGFDILDRLVNSFAPKHVVQLCTDSAKDLPKDQPDWKELGSSIHCPPAHGHSAPGGFSAVDSRSLLWLSFCLQCAATPLDLSLTVQELFSHAADALCRCPPYKVALSSIKVVSSSPLDFPTELLPGVLNASLVGLAKEEEIEAAGTCYPIVGYGLVRSVDAESGDIFVLTSCENLEEIGVLVLGAVTLPQRLLQSESYQSPFVAHGALTVEGIGAGIIKGRNNMRRGRLEA